MILVEAAEIPPPYWVKMDVEGSEHLVFQGAHSDLSAHICPTCFLEYIAEFDPETARAPPGGATCWGSFLPETVRPRR